MLIDLKIVVLYLWSLPFRAWSHSPFSYSYGRYFYISDMCNIPDSWIINLKQIVWFWIPAPPFISSVIFSKLLNFLGLSFLIYKTNNRTYHIRLLWRLNDIKSHMSTNNILLKILWSHDNYYYHHMVDVDLNSLTHPFLHPPKIVTAYQFFVKWHSVFSSCPFHMWVNSRLMGVSVFIIKTFNERLAS